MFHGSTTDIWLDMRVPLLLLLLLLQFTAPAGGTAVEEFEDVFGEFLDDEELWDTDGSSVLAGGSANTKVRLARAGIPPMVHRPCSAELETHSGCTVSRACCSCSPGLIMSQMS